MSESMSKKILIVNDEPHILKVLQSRLEVSGYAVIVANNGPEGIKKTKIDKPDLILTDIKMPQMDGIKMVKKIRRFNALIPVIFITAYPEEYAIKDVQRLKPAGYITLGIDFAQQVEVINQAIEVTRNFKKK